MELALSLGDTPPKGFAFLGKVENMKNNKDLGFCMGLGKQNESEEIIMRNGEDEMRRGSADPVVPLQLDLLPFSPVNPRNQMTSSQLRFPWLSENCNATHLLHRDSLVAAEPGSIIGGPGKGLELNRRSSRVEEADEGAAISSPNSVVSSFQMDYSNYRSGGNKRYFEAAAAAANEGDADRYASSRASDEEENGGARKKLRLTKEQSAFLEESFKEHHSLNPKQKLALAKQLNLRPRQVEVWFQNRRARTKLKQTEVDCEYLKRCCDALTEENRRLQKELQELRALKTSQPFYMQLPATTLTMCPSCERTVSNSTSTATATTTTTAAAATANTANTTLTLAKPNVFPFSSAQFQAPQAAS